MQLRKWQKFALVKFKASTEPFLIEACPGAGKTIFAAECANYLLNDSHECDFVIIVVPTTALKDSMRHGFFSRGVEIKSVVKASKPLPTEYKGIVTTYAQLPNLVQTMESVWSKSGKRFFVIFDEVHHCSSSDDTGNQWGSAAEAFARKATRIMCMSGTPFRGDGRKISFVKYDDRERAIPNYPYTYESAVADGVCREVEFIYDNGTAKYAWLESTHEHKISETPEKRTGAVAKTVFDKESEFLEKIIIKADSQLDEFRVLDPDAGGIIICRPGYNDDDDRHMHVVADKIEQLTGERPVEIGHKDTDASLKIDKFKSGNAKWVCSVRMISEGIDIPRLRVMLMATFPGTELLFRQLVGRVVRTEKGCDDDTAKVFIAELPPLVEMAKRIRLEAEAGLKKKLDPKDKDDNDKEAPSIVTPLGCTFEAGGAIDGYGDLFSADEINMAETMRNTHQQLRKLPVTSIAYMNRLNRVSVPETVEPSEPRQDKIKRLRTNLNSKIRRYIVITNGDFREKTARFWKDIAVKNIDDLCDNYPISKIEKAIDYIDQLISKVPV